MIDADLLSKAIDDHVRRVVVQSITPLVNVVVGVELAIGHVFNALHQKGVLDRDEAIASLAAFTDQHRDSLAPETVMALGHIKSMLEGATQSDPNYLRERFQLILGGLSEPPPEG
jgi:hypothetical protein